MQLNIRIKALSDSLDIWKQDVLSKMDTNFHRPFTLGDPAFSYTQMPARDGRAHGSIKRSNRWPNCSFFEHWTSVQDSITWKVNVLAEGDFEVSLYYTCPAEDIGSTISLSFGDSELRGRINKAFSSPLRGMQHDLVKRKESYVKIWKRKELGTLHLDKGSGRLTLKAMDIPGSQVMDFRMLIFKRLGN